VIPIFVFLGMCSGYADTWDTSHKLCESEIEARYRIIEVDDEYDDFEREWFLKEVGKVVWPPKK